MVGFPIMEIGIGKRFNKERKSDMNEQDILDWVGNEIKDCEWCDDMTYDDYNPILEIEVDGKRFEISVKKI